MRTGTIIRLAVAATALATMAQLVVLSRLVSALLGAELVLFAPGLALAGAGLGAAWAGLTARAAAPPRLVGRIGALLGAGSFALIVSTIALCRLAPPQDGGLASPARLALVFALAATPFVLVSAALVAAHAHARTDAPRLAAFDLAGAAAGVLAGVLLLRGVGAPRAALVLAIALAAVGAACATAARAPDRGGHPAAAFGLLMGAISVLAGDLGAPWLKLTYTRGARVDRAEVVLWSELGLVTADIPQRGGTAWIHTDGVGTSGALPAAAPPPKHPDQLAFALFDDPGPVLVVGAGGGREVRAALEAGATQVFATEVNRQIVDGVVRAHLREHAGDVFDRAGVEVVITDARGYAARNEGAFRTVVSSVVDTGAAGAAGALVRSESGLYTVEGVRALVRALRPDGALVVSRWDEEAPRLVGLVAAALREEGARAPRDHLYACSHQRSTAVLVGRRPLGEERVGALRAFCRKARFKEVLAPDLARPDLAALLADPAAAEAESDRDLSPPTDDRPFYFHGVKPGRLWSTLRDPSALGREPLLLPAAVVAGLGALTLLVLTAVARIAARVRGAARLPGGLLFFACAGGGYALVQASLVQRLALYVAHPSHALYVVLLSLLVSAAVGASGARRIPAASLEGATARRALALAVLSSSLALLLDPLLGAAAALPSGARGAVAVAICAPVGALAGGLGPLALRALSSWAPERAALAAGVGGGAALLATGAGAVLALTAGLSFLLLVAAAAYLVAGVANPRPAHGRA